MKCTISIRMDNAAFEGADCGSELAMILQHIAGRLESYAEKDFPDTFTLHDSNGNTVGNLDVTAD